MMHARTPVLLLVAVIFAIVITVINLVTTRSLGDMHQWALSRIPSLELSMSTVSHTIARIVNEHCLAYHRSNCQ